MQQTIGKQEVRRIYALGAGAGLLNGSRDGDAHDDDLHAVVHKLTGKESVSKLSREEYAQVERYLLGQLSNAKRTAPERPARGRGRYGEHPGGVTADQQRMIWYQLYQLRDKDGAAYSKATLGERLCGIIRKQFHRDCTPERPFAFLTLADGWRLIEVLKKMNKNVKPKGGTRNGNA